VTFRIRDAQTAALRRNQIVKDLSGALAKDGQTASFDESTWLLRATDAAGHTSRYQLGSGGKLEAYTTPSGRTSQVSFDDHGSLEDLVEPSGRRTQVACDQDGVPLKFVSRSESDSEDEF
jgi:uncharacterized protein RhaS with RHS repeats